MVAVLEVKLCKAKPKDAVALGQIQVTSWRSASRNIASDNCFGYMVSEENQANDWNEILAKKEAVVFIAEVENTPVGHAWAQANDDKFVGWDSELISMRILSEHKRQKIGRKLFAAAATELKAQGCKTIYLSGCLKKIIQPANSMKRLADNQLANSQSSSAIVNWLEGH